jgi:hypothetical protein
MRVQPIALVLPVLGIALFPLCVPAETVRLEVTPRLHGRVLRIEGRTDLPDNARIDWQARHAEMNTRRDFPVERMSNSGRVAVRGGRYSATVDLSAWPNGAIEVWVAFEPLVYNNDQPRFVTRLFGEYGQQLSGPNIETNGQFRNMFRAVAVQRVFLKGPEVTRRPPSR